MSIETALGGLADAGGFAEFLTAFMHHIWHLQAQAEAQGS